MFNSYCNQKAKDLDFLTAGLGVLKARHSTEASDNFQAQIRYFLNICRGKYSLQKFQGK